MRKVSVIVATYRREKELKRALDSLAEQTYDNFEIIIVDDNGDEEWNKRISIIIKGFAEKNPDLCLKYIVNNPNQGSAKTRNIGIDAASGEYITFLDDDDIYLPEKIERQVLFMEKENYDFSITNLFLYDESERLVSKRIHYYIKSFDKESVFKYHLKYHLTGTDTMMFKKDYIQSIGGFSPIDVGDEYYLMEKAVVKGGRFGYLDVCDIKAYIHKGKSEGLSSGIKKIAGEKELFNHKKQYFKNLNRSDIRYIKARHYAVNAFAYLRIKKRFKFFIEGMKAFLSSPISCVKILRDNN